MRSTNTGLSLRTGPYSWKDQASLANVPPFSASPSTESIPVAEDILLDVSSPSPSSNVACTDKNGCAHIVDIGTGTVVANWKAHSLPYTSTGCEASGRIFIFWITVQF
ncbi:hypothetical protein Y032_0008g253 [Ancylostoma ceylanicum]|uniref:Uncharacterized protein n=1 Tax=Ancylostoma ceylanicum TaxID=53326 RepID=A0A016VMB7_9BILA|nr:hypothetical protein Y032_0008g253 [Ancylostoma ceylanicum]